MKKYFSELSTCLTQKTTLLKAFVAQGFAWLPADLPGRISAWLPAKLKKPLLFIPLLPGCAVLLAAVVWYAQLPLPLSQIQQWPTSAVLLDKDGNLIHAELSSHSEWSIPIALKDMGKWLPLVVVTVEDKRFEGHCGVDFLALCRAALQNIRAGRVVSGASTISSQVIRISFPKARNLQGKLSEFGQAIKLERHLNKEQILEIYLNRAPFGGPIRGVEAASRLYFGKQAKDLSLGEAALLAGLLKGPTAYRPDRNPKAALARRDFIIKLTAKEHKVTPQITALALQEPLPAFKSNMPARAFHYARLAFADKGNFSLRALPSGSFPGAVPSPLDSRLQSFVEFTLKEALFELPPNLTAAAAVLDNQSGGLVAYVGNARFDPARRKHWVDCGQAPRSPGSTLKPFAYLLAFEQGQLIPASLLADTPLAFAGRAPRNFDLTYRGPVAASTALAESLNAPAVRVLRMVGGENLQALLQQLGFKHINKPFGHYGDSFILGGLEVTLLELATAYSTLAREGLPATASPLPSPYFLTRPSTRASRLWQQNLPVNQIFSREAAWLITEILSETGRIDPLLRQILTQENRVPAFKTGTSYGLRDAWSVAYSPLYTVAVWFGDETGAPDPNLVGLKVSVPATLKILRQLPVVSESALNAPAAQTESATGPASELLANESAQYAGQYPSVHTLPSSGRMPRGISYKEVCALSGAAPGPYCPSTQKVPVITKTWRTAPCALHVLQDGKPALVWPAELVSYARLKSAQARPDGAVFITSPPPGTEYLLARTATAQKIPLRCEGAFGKVHWYVDKQYFASADAAQSLFWTLTPGRHTLSVLDSNNKTDAVQINVIDLKQPKSDEDLLN